MADDKKAKKSAKSADKKADKKKSGKNPFKAIGSFFKSVRSEGRKVVWPKAAEVWKNTLVVLVVILILGVIIYAIDFGLTEGMKGIKNLAQQNTTTTTEAADVEDNIDEAFDLVDEANADADTEEEAEGDTAEAQTEEATEAETEADTSEVAD